MAGRPNGFIFFMAGVMSTSVIAFSLYYFGGFAESAQAQADVALVADETRFQLEE